MRYLDLLGLAAGTLTTLAFFPQVIRAYKLKETRDLSLAMYVLFSFGLVLWIVYGFLTGAIPVIAANLVTLALCFYLIYLKKKYG